MEYANHISWSDIEPFEVVKVISDKTIEIREMDAELDNTWKPDFIVGGFAAHCANQREQRWNIKSNETYPTIRIRLSKNRGWRDSNGRKFVLSESPRKFYDYNF